MKLEIEVDEAYIAELVSQVCWRYKSRGHEPDCELAALLKESEV